MMGMELKIRPVRIWLPMLSVHKPQSPTIRMPALSSKPPTIRRIAPGTVSGLSLTALAPQPTLLHLGLLADKRCCRCRTG